MPAWLIWGLFGAFWVIVLVRFWVTVRSLSRLRGRHPEAWRDLGAPTYWRRGTSGEKLSITGFLRGRRYLGLGDPVLTRLGSAWGIMNLILAGYLALLALIYLLLELRLWR